MSSKTTKSSNKTGGTRRVPAASLDKRVIADLLYVYNNKSMYINEKGYLQKLIELLYELGYYNSNKSLFS